MACSAGQCFFFLKKTLLALETSKWLLKKTKYISSYGFIQSAYPVQSYVEGDEKPLLWALQSMILSTLKSVTVFICFSNQNNLIYFALDTHVRNLDYICNLLILAPPPRSESGSQYFILKTFHSRPIYTRSPPNLSNLTQSAFTDQQMF